MVHSDGARVYGKRSAHRPDDERKFHTVVKHSGAEGRLYNSLSLALVFFLTFSRCSSVQVWADSMGVMK
eukprot:6302853-Amphidinium_carterae.1